MHQGDVAQMVERSLSMREALGSMPSFSTYAFADRFGRLVAAFNPLFLVIPNRLQELSHMICLTPSGV